MLAIRLQRTGRKGHAQFRIIVQDAHRTPSSGKIVEKLGQYNPHSKDITLQKDKVELYLKNGAQPSDKIARLLKKEGIKLPKWVEINKKKESKIRHQEKLRKNRPADAKKPIADDAVKETADVAPDENEKGDEQKEELSVEEDKQAEVSNETKEVEEPVTVVEDLEPSEDSTDSPTEDTKTL